MIQTIRKAWGIPELRKKIVFTLLILLIFRVGNAIPTPYINTELLGAYIDSTGGSLLSLYNVMSGGASRKNPGASSYPLVHGKRRDTPSEVGNPVENRGKL